LNCIRVEVARNCFYFIRKKKKEKKDEEQVNVFSSSGFVLPNTYSIFQQLNVIVMQFFDELE